VEMWRTPEGNRIWVAFPVAQSEAGEGASVVQASRLTPAEGCLKDDPTHGNIAQKPILESVLKK